MRESGRAGVRRRRRRVRTTIVTPSVPVAPNRIVRNFTAEAPYRLWCGDITYVPTQEADDASQPCWTAMQGASWGGPWRDICGARIVARGAAAVRERRGEVRESVERRRHHAHARAEDGCVEDVVVLRPGGEETARAFRERRPARCLAHTSGRENERGVRPVPAYVRACRSACVFRNGYCRPQEPAAEERDGREALEVDAWRRGAGSSPETQNVCRGEGSGPENCPVKLAPAKQESPSRKLAASAVGNKMPPGEDR